MSWLLKQVWFSVENSHVFLCQNVSNLVQSSLVFQTVFCLPASPSFTTRIKPREKTRASGSHDLSRLPQIENLLAGYVHTYDNFLLRVEEGGDENGERTRSSRSFPSPTPASQDLVLRPGGGGVLPYMGYIGMCRCEGYDFQAVYSRIGYIIFQETDQLVEDFI